MSDSNIPGALSPVTPEAQHLDLGGPQDVQATLDSLQQSLITNPVPSFGEQQYNQGMEFFKTNQPGLPASEQERMALDYAQQAVNKHDANKFSSQNAEAAKAQQIEATNLKRAQLGMAPLPGSPVQSAAAPAVDSNQYAVEVPPVIQGAKPVSGPANSDPTGLMGTYGVQQKKNLAFAEAMADKSVLEEKAWNDEDLRFKDAQKRQIDITSKFNDDYNSRIIEYEATSKELAAQDFTAPKIDGNNFWASKSTGQTILGAISIALGGYGGALTGKGDNKAMDIINKAIDRDIDAQKANANLIMESKKNKAQNMRDRLSTQSSMLSQLSTKYGSDVQAELAIRQLSLERTQIQLKSIAAKTESKVVQQNALSLNAGLEREKIIAGQAIKASIAQQTMLNTVGTEGKDWKDLTPVQKSYYPKDVRELYEKQAEVTAPGWHGQAPNKEVLSKFIEKQNETEPAINSAKRILALTDPFNPKSFSKFNMEDRAKASTELVALVGALRVPFTGPGILTDKEFDRLLGTIGDPTQLAAFPSIQRARLKTVLHKLTSDLDVVAKNSGFDRRKSVPGQSLQTLKPTQ